MDGHLSQQRSSVKVQRMDMHAMHACWPAAWLAVRWQSMAACAARVRPACHDHNAHHTAFVHIVAMRGVACVVWRRGACSARCRWA